MEEQEGFFSQNHNRLLNIATWSKYLAWIVLIVYILLVVTQVIQLLLAKDDGNFAGATSQSLSTMLRENPFNVFRLAVNMTATMLRGFIYYIVLIGISLGLNMIVETDINYREKGAIVK
jgi:hypothetical protein